MTFYTSTIIRSEDFLAYLKIGIYIPIVGIIDSGPFKTSSYYKADIYYKNIKPSLYIPIVGIIDSGPFKTSSKSNINTILFITRG